MSDRRVLLVSQFKIGAQFADDAQAEFSDRLIVWNQQAGRRLSDPETATWLRSQGVALVVLCGCREILSTATLEALPMVANVHPSALPLHRGPTPLFWTLRANELEFGVTIHEVSAVIDGGPILMQEMHAVPVNGDLEALTSAAMAASSDLGRRFLRVWFAGRTCQPRPIDASPYEPRPSDAVRTITAQTPLEMATSIVRACGRTFDVVLPDLQLRGRFGLHELHASSGQSKGPRLAVACSDGVLFLCPMEHSR